MSMNVRQLSYLVALSSEGSFTRAAAASNVAQPALSRQIQKLERELGLPLVDRTTRRVSLTPAGQEVVAVGNRVLNELDSLRQSLHQTKNMLQGTVTIGVTSTPGPVDIPKLLGAFSRSHPGVELVLREGLSVELAGQLREDRLDVALISGIALADRDQLELKPYRAERLVVLLPAGHPLASRPSLTIADLRSERFVAFPPGATIRGTVERAARQAGFVPRASIEIGDASRAVALVADGLGVAVLPESEARVGSALDTVVQPLNPPLRYEIFVAHRARRHLVPAAEALREMILGTTT